MAVDSLTTADMVADALDVGPAEMRNIIDASPFLARLPIEFSSNGTTHKYNTVTGAPIVGFRAENVGIENDHSDDTVETVTLKILDCSFWVDQAVAHGSPSKSREEVIAKYMAEALRAGFFAAEKQYIRGTNSDVSGGGTAFTGIEQSTVLDDSDDALVVNAGGTAATTGSSVYLIKEGGTTGVAGVMIQDAPLAVGEVTSQSKELSSKTLQVYNVPLWAWWGIQIGGRYSIVRIANLTEDAGKGMTDDLFYKALETFPVGDQPTLCIGNRRSMRQWRESRTATNGSGTPAPSISGTTLEGVDIMAVESIVSTETLLTAA